MVNRDGVLQTGEVFRTLFERHHRRIVNKVARTRLGLFNAVHVEHFVAVFNPVARRCHDALNEVNGFVHRIAEHDNVALCGAPTSSTLVLSTGRRMP